MSYKVVRHVYYEVIRHIWYMSYMSYDFVRHVSYDFVRYVSNMTLCQTFPFYPLVFLFYGHANWKKGALQVFLLLGPNPRYLCNSSDFWGMATFIQYCFPIMHRAHQTGHIKCKNMALDKTCDNCSWEILLSQSELWYACPVTAHHVILSAWLILITGLA